MYVDHSHAMKGLLLLFIQGTVVAVVVVVLVVIIAIIGVILIAVVFILMRKQNGQNLLIQINKYSNIHLQIGSNTNTERTRYVYYNNYYPFKLVLNTTIHARDAESSILKIQIQCMQKFWILKLTWR